MRTIWSLKKAKLLVRVILVVCVFVGVLLISN